MCVYNVSSHRLLDRWYAERHTSLLMKLTRWTLAAKLPVVFCEGQGWRPCCASRSIWWRAGSDPSASSWRCRSERSQQAPSDSTPHRCQQGSHWSCESPLGPRLSSKPAGESLWTIIGIVWHTVCTRQHLVNLVYPKVDCSSYSLVALVSIPGKVFNSSCMDQTTHWHDLQATTAQVCPLLVYRQHSLHFEAVV